VPGQQRAEAVVITSARVGTAPLRSARLVGRYIMTGHGAAGRAQSLPRASCVLNSSDYLVTTTRSDAAAADMLIDVV